MCMRRILFVETEEIQLQDIPHMMKRMGYEVDGMSLGCSAQRFREDACSRVREGIRNMGAGCAMTYDFALSVARACLEEDVPYISWIYDDPQQELYTIYAQYPCNYIFVFDREQQKRLKKIGIRKVYYMPLAADGARAAAASPDRASVEGDRAQIAFVGQLYRIKSLEEMLAQADGAVRREMEDSMSRCFFRWERGLRMHGSMTAKCTGYFSGRDGHQVPLRFPFASKQFYYEAAVMSRLQANRERVYALNQLSQKHDVRFYTFDEDTGQLSGQVRIMPGAKYHTEVWEVYRQSRINLNITLHCIETGASQRVFDVMAAGGFLLSNYQEELEELFVPGEELVLFHDMEELEYYTDYYLAHEEERRRIAGNGQKKVLKYHDYCHRMQEVMRIVEEGEQERSISYREELAAGIPLLELRRDLHICHDLERQFGQERLLDGLEREEAAGNKYLELWETVQGLKTGSGEEDYARAAALLRQKEISALFMVWLVCVKTGEPKQILQRLCDCLFREHMATAIEALTYGILLLGEPDELFLKKAEYLLELSMWQEALEALRQIKRPDEDISRLVRELETALRT